MIEAYSNNDILLEIQFEDQNTSEHLFGVVNWSMNNIRLSGKDSEYLGYFYVSAGSMLLHLEQNEVIENALFKLSDSELLKHYTDWTDSETNNSFSDYFDDHYFKTGNVFNCRLFDHQMLLYEFDNQFVRFKSWKKTVPKKVYTIEVNRSSLMECLKSYLQIFDDEIDRLKKMEN